MMHHSHDRYYSWHAEEATPEFLEFGGTSPIEHTLYLGFAGALATPEITEMELRVTLEKPTPDKRSIEWAAWTASGWSALAIIEDTTGNLSRSGTIRFQAVPVMPSKVTGIENRWIRARLASPIYGPVTTPSICSVGLQVSGKQKDLPRTSAFAELQALDLTRDFLPFGARPAFGATFYISNSQALSVPDAEVTIEVDLTNPFSGGPEPPIPRVNASGLPVLSWEFWDGRYWSVFGTSETGRDRSDQFPQFEDTTRAFTKTGHVKFRLPVLPKPIRINGVEGPWIRVRMISGDYGAELPPPVAPSPPPTSPAEAPVRPARVRPPSIQALWFQFEGLRTAERPEKILDWNDFKWTDQTGYSHCFQPFRSDKNLPVAMYFGFNPPPNTERPFGRRSISLYLVINATALDSADTLPSVIWQYWSGSEWKKWTVQDESAGLTASGPVRFLAPPDFAVRSLFGQPIYWLRAMWTEKEPEVAPVSRILMNTVMATNAETVSGEILGSSNGDPDQVFRTLRKPVLDDPVVEVRAPHLPAAVELARIEQQEGPDAVREITNSAGQVETWIRWHEVQDFLESEPLDFHYVMDHISGEVRFGDNTRGMIPPVGSGNIKASYRTGGGAAGNRKPGQIVSLKTTVPYVNRVYNYVASDGGVDAEEDSELEARGPRILRHRNRAVASEDYEDLVLNCIS